MANKTEHRAKYPKKKAVEVRSKVLLKAIIFDFDDTVENFKSAHELVEKKMAKVMLQRYGVYPDTTAALIREIDKEQTRKGRGKPVGAFDRKEWAKVFFRQIGLKATAREITEFEDLYWRFAIEGAKPMPYARQVLQKLKKNYKIIMLSDSDGADRIKTERMKTVGLYDCFHYRITGNQVGYNKPNRKAYKKILDKYGLKPSECMMVGDKPEVDLELAKKLGMTTVWMRFGRWNEGDVKKKPYVDHEIKDLRQIHRILAEMCKLEEMHK